MYNVIRLSSEEWKAESETAHAVAFGEYRSNERERVDFALLAFKDERPVGYVQCIEMSSTHLYWQYGGAFEQKSVTAVGAFLVMLDWCLVKFQQISLRVENKNIPMIKLALKMGFLIVGSKISNGKMFLEFLKERE